ncbi:unnamed protein product [Protopolystoma xenopodis]|uniref:Uncharacterized protein n=1 Tax=Protopolystoma xenopodis TaxID=117903 RepID=A0A448XGX4_9PLAT|nr:unnamed protein product [Protopolystoma xenopodis]
MARLTDDVGESSSAILILHEAVVAYMANSSSDVFDSRKLDPIVGSCFKPTSGSVLGLESCSPGSTSLSGGCEFSTLVREQLCCVLWEAANVSQRRIEKLVSSRAVRASSLPSGSVSISPLASFGSAGLCSHIAPTPICRMFNSAAPASGSGSVGSAFTCTSATLSSCTPCEPIFSTISCAAGLATNTTATITASPGISNDGDASRTTRIDGLRSSSPTFLSARIDSGAPSVGDDSRLRINSSQSSIDQPSEGLLDRLTAPQFCRLVVLLETFQILVIITWRFSFSSIHNETHSSVHSSNNLPLDGAGQTAEFPRHLNSTYPPNLPSIIDTPSVSSAQVMPSTRPSNELSGYDQHLLPGLAPNSDPTSLSSAKPVDRQHAPSPLSCTASAPIRRLLSLPPAHILSLHNLVVAQAINFIHRFHADRCTKLTLMLDHERWQAADQVPDQVQQLINRLFADTNEAAKDYDSLTKMNELPSGLRRLEAITHLP